MVVSFIDLRGFYFDFRSISSNNVCQLHDHDVFDYVAFKYFNTEMQYKIVGTEPQHVNPKKSWASIVKKLSIFQQHCCQRCFLGQSIDNICFRPSFLEVTIPCMGSRPFFKIHHLTYCINSDGSAPNIY
jgi:hypothetical protein